MGRKNIRWWADRWYMYFVFLLLLTFVYLVLPINQLVKFDIIGIILLIAIYDIPSVLLGVLITLGYLMIIFTLLFSIGLPPLNKTFTIFHLVGTSFLAGEFTSLIIYLYIK